MSAVLDRSAIAAPPVVPPSAPASDPLPSVRVAPPMRSVLQLRLLLVGGCLAAMAAATVVGDPAPFIAADPDLARLLRGMAAIKLGIVLAAVGVLGWRFGRPVPPRSAAAYLAGAWLVAGASVLVWQLTHLVGAGLAFHAGELTLLGVAWRDRSGRFGRP